MTVDFAASRAVRHILLPFLLLLPGCAVVSLPEESAAERALEQAREAGARGAAPRALESAQRSLAQGRQLFQNGDHGRAAVRFDAAARRAAMAERLVARRHRLDRDRALRMLGRAEEGLRELEWLSTYLPPRSPIRAGIKKAEVSVAEARTLIGQKDAPRALEAARDARRLIGSAHQRFARFILGSADPERSTRYRRWVDETIQWSRSRKARAIIVDKMRRTLTLVSSGRRVHMYRAELGINGTLDKVVAGDRATPEGKYKVVEKRDIRQTRWYKALLINYPNKEDLKRFKRARRRGEISSRAQPGSLIEIHGEGGRGGDWTDGCVALANGDMDHLFARVSVGTPVTIVGFEVTGTKNSRSAGGAGASP